MTARSLDFYGTTAFFIGAVLGLVTAVVSLLEGWSTISTWIGGTAVVLLGSGSVMCAVAWKRFRE